jgi:ATP-dependent Clp protease ATP-binding subunit ClpA
VFFATTSEDYHKYIMTDAALERHFQKVDVEEPRVHATFVVLRRLKHKYQAVAEDKQFFWYGKLRNNNFLIKEIY